jgi:hypothetical protein
VSGLEVTSNRIARPLYSANDLSTAVLVEFFDYAINDTDESAHFFQYRGWWYDAHEFTVAPDEFKARGWDGVQPDSMGTGVAVQWFDRDGEYRYDEIVVGYFVYG